MTSIHPHNVHVRKKPLLVPAVFLFSMLPLLAGIVTDKSVSATPPVTITVSTQLMLSAVDTDLVVTTPAVVDARPKSATTTPVTALSKVAVYLSSLPRTTVADGPRSLENVGVGGVYLHMWRTIQQVNRHGQCHSHLEAHALRSAVSQTHVNVSVPVEAAGAGEMLPEPGAMLNDSALVARASSSSVTVRTHSVPEPVTA